MGITSTSVPILPLLHLISFFSYGFFFCIIFIKNPKARVNKYCGLVLLCFMIWCLGKVVTHFPDVPLEMAVFYRNLTIVGAWLLGPSLFLFSLALTEKHSLIKNKLLWLLLLFIPLFSIGLQWYDNRLLSYIPSFYGWGLSWKYSFLTFVLLTHIFLTIFVSGCLCLLFSFKVQGHNRRIQCRIIGSCIVGGLIIGYGTNIIAPVLDLKIPDIAQNLGIIWMAGLVFAIVKYDFLSLSPSTAAEEIISTMTDALFLVNVNHQVITINSAGLRLLDGNFNDFVGVSLDRVFPSGKISQLTDEINESVSEIKDTDDVIQTFQNSLLPVSVSISPQIKKDGQLGGWIIIARDISERVTLQKELEKTQSILEERVASRTQELSFLNQQLSTEIQRKNEASIALKKSEELFRLISEQSLLGIIIIYENRIVYCNEAWCEMVEFSVEEMRLWGPLDFIKHVHPDDREHMLDQAQKKQQGSTDIDESYHWRLITKSKKEKWISMYSKPISFKGGIAILSTLIDISERKKIFLSLKESEEKYRLLVENANDSIFIIQGGLIQFVNSSTCKMGGYTQDELLGVPFEEFVHSDDREAALERYMKRLKGEPIPKTHTFRVLHKSGEFIIVQTNAVGIIWQDSPATLNFARDITEEKKYENMLTHRQRLDAVGSMAGGIAHDFNNLLTPILGYAEMLQEDLAEFSEQTEYIESIITAAERARELIQQIITFSRQKTVEKQKFDLCFILNEAMKLSRAVLPKNISIKSSIDRNCGSVLADPTQIHQVAMNLITNAHQAMVKEGGVLSLSLKRADQSIDDQKSEQKYIVLSVSDTGVGMDKSTLGKIFDPYFSTKKRRSGLGLPVVLAIIKNLKGHIEVESEFGKGSQFRVFLPEIEKEELQQSPETTMMLGTKIAGKIMLIDDEPNILKLYESLLIRRGYRVESFEDPKEALDAFCHNPSGYSLVITDMSMPGLTGDRVAKEILKTHPNFPIIINTGYSEMLSPEEAEDLGIGAYLTKPATTQELLSSVHKVLEKQKTTV